MASEQQVKQYLAQWFQLGKRIMLRNGQEIVSLQSVIQGDRYSSEFEDCWQYILSSESGDCYLEGTFQTIQELLSPKWEIESCVRCDMPIPMISLGSPSESCPCSDIPTWLNMKLPLPRLPISSQERLKLVQQRLRKKD